MIRDDDPPARRMKPSGKLDQLTEAGARNRPDLRAGPLLVLPEFETPGQKRRFAKDYAIFQAHLNGGSYRAIAKQFGYSDWTCREAVKRIKELIHPKAKAEDPES